MRETNEVNALYAFLSFLLLPAILLLFFGIRNWYNGVQAGHEDKLRWGKMFTMFGVIFVVILLICSYFLKGKLPG
jgi:ABC-type transport system involved in multi-copper enzyme maturation permease subunit